MAELPACCRNERPLRIDRIQINVQAVAILSLISGNDSIE